MPRAASISLDAVKVTLERRLVCSFASQVKPSVRYSFQHEEHHSCAASEAKKEKPGQTAAAETGRDS